MGNKMGNFTLNYTPVCLNQEKITISNVQHVNSIIPDIHDNLKL